MTNNILAFDFNGVKVVRDSNTELIRLTSPADASPATLHDSRDDTNYQVPTGKKAHVIFVEASSLNAAANQLISSTSADSTAGEVVLFKPDSNITNLIFISSEIAAELFINVVDAAQQALTIHIVEENA